MRIFLILCVFACSALSVWAQETSDELPIANTPRQKVVDTIETAPSPDPISDVVLGLRGTADPTAKIDELSGLNEEEPDVSDSEPAAKDKDRSEEAEDLPSLLPFYTSAADYVAQRGGEKQPQLILEYEVETSELDDSENVRTEQVQLILGTDFASLQGLKSQKIYDFKMNRYLEIKPVKSLQNESDTALFFDNNSIYAKAYRNINTVRQATQNGKKRRIKISKDLEIDSFWLESSMSWAATKLDGPLKVKSTKSDILAIWDGLSVASARFDDTKYENDQFKNALFAFAHHAWPIHPQILVEFYNYDSPPGSLEMVSFGPTQPKGQKQKWTLTNRETTDAGFPLPADALSAVERRPVSPLVFVISEAVKNRALGGMQTPQQIEGDFEAALKAQNKVGQWIAGQKYIAYTGKCQNKDESWLCAALDDLSDSNKFTAIGALDPKTKTLSDFINATAMTKSKKDRATGLLALQPYLDDQDTPSIILRSAAMARASMKKAEAAKSGLGSIQAEALLKQALAKDPYDPHTYVGLAQVYAANGAFEQSWDIYDALRAGIPTVDAISLKIGKAEDKLIAAGPGYFIPQ